MNDRFNFNAIVTGYYDIDTPENYEEYEPQMYLHNVDVFSDEIGIDYDRLITEVEKQLKLDKPETNQIMQYFEDNSNSSSDEYITIKPDRVLQCTGLKDKNSKLIYEGDIVKETLTDFINKEIITVVKWDKLNTSYNLENLQNCEREVIGNVYQNPELLEE